AGMGGGLGGSLPRPGGVARRPGRYRRSMAHELPLVSVVMPVRNESEFIGQNLEAVLAQDYPADRLEVLVADGMSEDGTRDIVRQFVVDAARRGGARVKLVDNPGRIMPT